MSDYLSYDVPQSKGAENALKRAQTLANIRWRPCQELAIFGRKGTSGFIYPARNGKTCTEPTEYGIPYSSARVMHGFVGLDISLDTFLTAVKNPASIVYTRNFSDFHDPDYNCTITNTFFAYGTVCSAFATYTLDLPTHRSTHEWGSAPEFYEIIPRDADSLVLCDSLVSSRPNGHTGGHVRIVTGIARDHLRRVKMVEISEGVTAYARSKWYSAEEVNATFSNEKERYRIFRYRYLDSVQPPAPLTAPDNPELMLDHGDLSNYYLGEPVAFNLGTDTETLIIENGQDKKEISLCDLAPTEIQGNLYRIYSTDTLSAGRYRAYCMKDGRQTPTVRFAVVKLPEITLSTPDGTPFNQIALKPVAPDGTPLTADSPCFYDESKKLLTGSFKIAFTDGTRLIPASAAVRMLDGKLVVRPAATLTDKEGNPQTTFCVGDDVTLYALQAPNNTVVRAAFSNNECCDVHCYHWTEERVISYQQGQISADERLDGYVDTILKRYLDDFANIQIICTNEYGNVVTRPITFVVT